MSSLEEVYAGDRGPLRVALWGALLSVGGLFVAAGFAAATASLVAGFGVSEAVALKVALALAGGSLLAGYLGLLGRATHAAGHASVAGVGTVVAVAGLALFWLTLPAGWPGDLATLPPTAVGVYAVGLLTVLSTVLAAAAGDDATRGERARAAEGSGTEPLGGVESAVSRTRIVSGASADRDEPSAATAPSADGGTEDDDLRFFEE